MKLMSQFFPTVLALIFLCISLWYGKIDSDSLRDVFLGAFLGTLGIAFVNFVSILFTYKNGATAQNNFKKEIVNEIRASGLSGEIAEKLKTSVLNNIKFVQESFEESVKATLVQVHCNEIYILANKGKQFLKTFDGIDFSCNELTILLQDTKLNEEEIEKIKKEWKTFYDNKKGNIKQIAIYKTSKDSDKLIYGMIINQYQGIMGFYTPNTTEVLNAFGFNSDILGQKELLNVIQSWFNYYLQGAILLGTIPVDDDYSNIKV